MFVTQGGCALKVSRILVVLALAGFAATAAFADGVDPTVIIRKVDPPPIVITSPSQTFDIIATSAQNIFAFQNETGITLTALTLDLFAGKSGLLYSCGSFAGADIFATCSSSSGSAGDTIISFLGVGNGFTGIEAATCSEDDKGKGDDKNGKDNNSDDKDSCTGGIYSLEFDGIPPGAKVEGIGTFTTPEPMTAMLLVSGLVGLAGFRKRRNA
jgi:hypothetical protein